MVKATRKPRKKKTKPFQFNHDVQEKIKNLELMKKKRDELMEKIVADNDSVLNGMSMEKLQSMLMNLPIDSLSDLHAHEKGNRFSVQKTLILKDKVDKLNKKRFEELNLIKGQIERDELDIAIAKINNMIESIDSKPSVD